MKRIFDDLLKSNLKLDIYKKYGVDPPDFPKGGEANILKGNVYYFRNDGSIFVLFQFLSLTKQLPYIVGLEWDMSLSQWTNMKIPPDDLYQDAERQFLCQ